MTPGDGARLQARARVQLLGVPVDPVTVDELHDHLLRFVREKARATVLHANVHAINLAQRHPAFARSLRAADLVFCDGSGVMFGARLLRQHIPGRITYAEWLWELAALCERERLSLYLLGSRPGVADAAARRLCERFPGLRIAGAHHGYFDKDAASDGSTAIIASLNAAQPDILIVGFGMPNQELWVADHRHRIDASVVLTAGAAFDYVSGQLRRPPRWMTTHGLEWLGRLILEPRRLASRYLLGNPLFLWRVLRERMRQR